MDPPVERLRRNVDGCECLGPGVRGELGGVSSLLLLEPVGSGLIGLPTATMSEAILTKSKDAVIDALASATSALGVSGESFARFSSSDGGGRARVRDSHPARGPSQRCP